MIKHLIISLLLGLIATIGSHFYHIYYSQPISTLEPVSQRGWPFTFTGFGYENGFNFTTFAIDVLFWAIIVFAIIQLASYLKKGKK